MSKIIYAFTYPEYEGLLKVGETCRSVKERLRSNIIMPSECIVELEVECEDTLSDKDVHKELKKMGVRHINGEWFECTKEDVLSALLRLKGFSAFKGNVSIQDVESLIIEGQKVAHKFGSVNNLENLIESAKVYKDLKTDDIKKVEQISNILNGLEVPQREFIFKTIKNNNVDKTLERMNELKQKFEELKELGISEISEISNKNSTLDIAYKLFSRNGDKVFGVLDKIEQVKDTIKSVGISATDLDDTLKKFQILRSTSRQMKVDEKTCLEKIQSTIDIIERIRSESGCFTLSSLFERVETYNHYLENKDRIEKGIEKIKQEWDKLGVHNKKEFENLMEKMKKERRENNATVLCKLAKDKGITFSEDEVFRFGKYQGEKIKRIIKEDRAYIDW